MRNEAPAFPFQPKAPFPIAGILALLRLLHNPYHIAVAIAQLIAAIEGAIAGALGFRQVGGCHILHGMGLQKLPAAQASPI